MQDSFAIVYACPTGEMLVIPQNSFTQSQQAAIRHMVARAGKDSVPPGFVVGIDWAGQQPEQDGMLVRPYQTGLAESITSTARTHLNEFGAMLPGFGPLADGQQTVVHEVDRPDEVTRVAEQVSPALSPEAAMQANREAAKAQAKERAQQARSMGYTGDLCSQCGSDRMKRNGSCLCCEGCGATTGCS